MTSKRMLKIRVEDQEELISPNFFDTFGSILFLKPIDQEFEASPPKTNNDRNYIKNELLNNSTDSNIAFNLNCNHTNNSLISDNSETTNYMSKSNFKYTSGTLNTINSMFSSKTHGSSSELNKSKISINDLLKNPIKNEKRIINNQNQLMYPITICHISRKFPNLKNYIKFSEILNSKSINGDRVKIFKYKLFKKLIYLISESSRSILNCSKNYEKMLIYQIYAILKNHKIFCAC